MIRAKGQARATYFATGGDSGSPVIVTNSMSVAGTHSGTNEATGIRFFSPMYAIEAELGADYSQMCNGFAFHWLDFYSPC